MQDKTLPNELKFGGFHVILNILLVASFLTGLISTITEWVEGGTFLSNFYKVKTTEASPLPIRKWLFWVIGLFITCLLISFVCGKLIILRIKLQELIKNFSASYKNHNGKSC